MWYIIRPIVVLIVFVISMFIYVLGSLSLFILTFKHRKYNEWFSSSTDIGQGKYCDKNPLQTIKRYWRNI